MEQEDSMQPAPNRIDTKFRELRDAGERALVPFVTVGFPDIEMSEAVAEAIIESGGDMLELGIPFSDPLADGPTVQKASFRALQQGVTLRTALQVLGNLRQRGVKAPLIFMGYLNPFLSYGMKRFAREASGAGLDGVIVPDLPPEEAGPFQEMLSSYGIYLIPLLAPTSSDHRIAQACKGADGFIYCVSVTGVTGARRELAAGLPELVGRIRRHTDLPVVVGFGVSRSEHVEEIGRFADGVVVASALLDAIGQTSAERVLETTREFIKGLRASHD